MTRENSSGVDRRTLVKGALWTAPAISIAAAVPAFAGTTPTTNCEDLPSGELFEYTPLPAGFAGAADAAAGVPNVPLAGTTGRIWQYDGGSVSQYRTGRNVAVGGKNHYIASYYDAWFDPSTGGELATIEFFDELKVVAGAHVGVEIPWSVGPGNPGEIPQWMLIDIIRADGSVIDGGNLLKMRVAWDFNNIPADLDIDSTGATLAHPNQTSSSSTTADFVATATETLRIRYRFILEPAGSEGQRNNDIFIDSPGPSFSLLGCV